MKLLLLLVLLPGLFISCVSAPPKKATPVVAPFDAKKELSQIQVEMAAGGERRALARLKNLIVHHPKSDVADDATMLLANYYFKKGLYEPAYQTYIGLVNSDVFSPNEAQALAGASRSLHKLGRLDEALALNARALKIVGLADPVKLELYKERFALLTALGDRLDALRALGYIYAHEPRTEVKVNAQTRALEIVNRYLTLADLEKAVNDPEIAFMKPTVALRLATLRLQSKDLNGARAMFLTAAEAGKGTPIERQAMTYLGQLDTRSKVDASAIGAVLPLTGKHAAIAQKTLRGLQLGLGIYGADRSNFKLAVMDSEGTPESARRGVERLVAEDNVIAVVGSLLSKDAQTVAQKTEELGVPSIALSQKSGLTEGASYVFRDSVTSEQQIKELVKLAFEKLGMRKFAILYPNDSYGVEYANLFWDEVLARGGQVTGSQPYAETETDFRSPIRRLVGTYYLEDRKAEYEARLRDWYKKQKSLRGRANSPPDDLLPPIADFDAIFIPDSPKAVGQIAAMLAYQGISKTRLLGTNIWDSNDLVRRGQKNVENAVFVDTDINSDPEFKKSKFAVEYKKTFGEEPGLFEAQGYEAGMLLRQVISSGQNSRVGLTQALTGITQFQGVSGPMSMNTQRELVRPLLPLTVRQGQIVAWNPGFEIPVEATPPQKSQKK